MKIGFLIRNFNEGKSGAEANCFYLAKELVNLGHEVHIFCSGLKTETKIVSGIIIHFNKIIFKLSYYFTWYPNVTNQIIKENLDILHIHGLGFIQNDNSLLKIKKNKSNLKVFCTPHGPFMTLGHQGLLYKLVKFLYTIRIKKIIKSINYFIQVNPYQKQWMINEYKISPKKIILLPNGINKIKVNLNKNKYLKKYNLKDKFIISYLGRIQKYKGIDQIIKILPNMLKINKNIVFLGIGRDAGDKKKIRRFS